MSSFSRSESLDSPIGLALAGGAPGGAIYEIGALHALNEAIPGFDLRDCGSFVGVSAGAFLSSCLANGLSTAQQVRAIVKNEPGEHPFVPETFFQPALGELAKRLASTPLIVGNALRDYFTRRERRLLDALTQLGQGLPVGIFNNEPIRDYVARIFSIKGRTDDFTRLKRKLTVVATDLESGESMRFGHLGWPYVPISKAVQASTALPGLYPPVEINGRHYVDGILLKTMHASVPLEAGAKLVFCINPLVPVDMRQAVQRNAVEPGQILRRGLPSVLSQTVRTMIHSRLQLGVQSYEGKYPDADVILIEPARDDYEDFFSNIFSFSSRKAVCERAWNATRRSLQQRADHIQAVLDKYGLKLDREFLEDPEVDLWHNVGLPEFGRKGAPPKEVVLDELSGLLDRLESYARKAKARQAAAEKAEPDELLEAAV
jgi:NTE family protein